MEIFFGDEYYLCKWAVDKTPIHFLSAAYTATLKRVYVLGGSTYKLEIIYGPYALHAIVNLNDPELGLFFDYGSMILALQVCIESAIQEYDTEERKENT